MSELADRFAERARAFLAPLTADHVDAIGLAAALADLHAAALRLPAVDAPERGPMPEPALGALPDLPLDLYWETLEPLDVYGSAEAGTGSFYSDLSEIRDDVAEGLALFDAGRFEEAVWCWRFGFWSHWGAHLVSAQRALHVHLTR